ncbi:MAG: HAD family hydrolase [Bacteroidales bacterium]|nr:HAD family hydrolase [Bacteroidales bacterium]
MKRLAIFDLDGTIINSLGDLATACNNMLHDNGYPEHPLSAYNKFVGNGISKLIERALPENMRQKDYVELRREEFMVYYKAHIHDKTYVYDGITALFEELSDRKVLIAVASNKFQAGVDVLLKYFFPNIHFVAQFGQSDMMPVKPDSTMVHAIMNIAGATAEETLYMGDSNVDMKTALNAGLQPVGVTWGFRTREELIANGAWKIVDKPAEILSLL